MCYCNEYIYSCRHTRRDPIENCIRKILQPRWECPRGIKVTPFEKDCLCRGCHRRLKVLEDTEFELRNNILRLESQNRAMYREQKREMDRELEREKEKKREKEREMERMREEIMQLRTRSRTPRY
jgi:hypothetical protein